MDEPKDAELRETVQEGAEENGDLVMDCTPCLRHDYLGDMAISASGRRLRDWLISASNSTGGL